jgi:hypothetical protein
MAREPVFVIHGVANTNEEKFNEKVDALSVSLGNRWDLVPVFWNRLGSDPKGIDAAIPLFSLGSGVRSVELDDAGPVSPKTPGLELINAVPLMAPKGSETAVRAGDSKADVVADAAAARLSAEAGGEVREASPIQAEALRQAINGVWGELRYLPHLSDRQVLEEVGKLVADSADGGREEGAVTRDFRVNPLGFVRAVLHGADRVVGAVTGLAGEGLLWTVRSALIPMFAKGMGDVLVYEAHRAEIGSIVREKLAKYGYLGTSDRPAMVIGHSLGGIIAFDLAVGADPIFWSALVTFGSQSAILHVLDPRNPTSLAKFQPDPYQPVSLPATIGKWTNLFEPWDPLAFFASRVFNGANRSRIVDIEIAHLDSSGLWTHSVYWTNDDAIRAIRGALEEAPGTG